MAMERERADHLLTNGFSQLDWYTAEALRAEGKLRRCVWTGLIAGFLASALAAMPSELMKVPSDNEQWVRWSIAVLTLPTALSMGAKGMRATEAGGKRPRHGPPS